MAQSGYRITGAQESYLKRLLNEAFSNRYAHGLCMDPRRLSACPKAEASAAISALKTAKERGWK